MQKPQLLGKYRAGSNYSPKTTSYLAGSNYNQKHNNLSDCLVKSKYGKVVQTALYQQNYVVFEFQTGGISTPETSPWVRHWLKFCPEMQDKDELICLN